MHRYRYCILLEYILGYFVLENYNKSYSWTSFITGDSSPTQSTLAAILVFVTLPVDTIATGQRTVLTETSGNAG